MIIFGLSGRPGDWKERTESLLQSDVSRALKSPTISGLFLLCVALIDYTLSRDGDCG